MAIRVSWGHIEPHFGGRGGRRVSAMAPFERAIVVSYRLSFVHLTQNTRNVLCGIWNPSRTASGFCKTERM